jgi:predicted HD phosphohydrolase
MIKKTITIKGKYTGDDKSHLKKGDPMSIELDKDYLKASYMDDAFKRHINNVESITLINYVRQRVERICLTDSFYL